MQFKNWVASVSARVRALEIDKVVIIQKQWFSLLLVCILFAHPSLSTPKRFSLSSCLSYFWPWGASPSAKHKTKWEHWPELQRKLKTAHQKWLADPVRIKKAMSPTPWFARVKTIGETVTVGKTVYPIKEVIGKGHEGVIYVVETMDGDQVVKAFGSENTASENIYALEKSQLPTPTIYEIDAVHNTARMQYVRGIPLKALAESGQYYGLSAGDVREIEVQKNLIPYFGVDQNRVLDIETGQIFEVDPY